MRVSFHRTGRRPDWPAWAVLIVIIWISLAGVAFSLSMWRGAPLELCLFKRVTHIPCPTCGSTRILLALARGDVGHAFVYNPFMFLLGACLGVWLFLKCICGISLRVTFSSIEKKTAWTLVIAAFLLNWMYVIYSLR